MLFRCRRIVVRQLAKLICTTARKNYKVAVIGASGGIGQPLSLLLKTHPRVTKLSLYDLSKITPGVAVDLSHINTCTCVNGFTGKDGLGCALSGAHVVVIPAGLPRKPGMSRQDLFDSNAKLVQELFTYIVKYCPCAFVAMITNPVNSMVPIAVEVLAKYGICTANHIFGVTTLDLVRASTFVSEVNKSDPTNQHVPVVGGHAGTTIVPLLSQSKPEIQLSDKDRAEITKKIQEAGTTVVKAKAGGGSATLSMAFSAARFVDSLLRALSGEPNVLDYAYVKSQLTQAAYFSSPIILGSKGIQQICSYGEVNEFENELITKAIPQLDKNIKAGVDYVKKNLGSCCKK